MGRPPSNGGPSFRFNQSEVAEMEAILQAHKTAMPERDVLVTLAEKFSNSDERKGKFEVQMKQVWNWFQNRRYAIRAKTAKSPGKFNITPMTRDDSATVNNVPQATQPLSASSATIRPLPQVSQHLTGSPATVRAFPQAQLHPAAFLGKVADNSQMEYEAKSARDGAWYDVSIFLSHRSLETRDPEVLVRFAGFGAEEDEWVNVCRNVRQRSLPCESSECVAVLPADLILCFQEGKEQALYFDAHVLDAQRRRHDVRGCRCRFLVRYDHDQSEEIVALRKICRRPETDYRLQQLHAVNDSVSANLNKNGANNNIHPVSTLRVYPPPAEVQSKQQHVPPSPAQVPQKRQKVDHMVPEPSQSQFKVEPVVLAPSDIVPQNQHNVQPVVPSPSPDVPQNQHNVQPVEPGPMVAPDPSIDPQNMEPKVADTSVQSSAVSPDQHKVQPPAVEAADVSPGQHEVQPSQAIEAVVQLPSAEVSPGQQEVQPSQAVKAVVLPSAQVSTGQHEVQPSQAVEAVVPLPPAEVSPGQHEVQPPEIVEPVSLPSAEVSSGQHEVQPDQAVEAVVLLPSAEVSPGQHEVQPAITASAETAMESGESEAPAPSTEVPVEQHKEVPLTSVKVQEDMHDVQPLVPDQPCTNAPDTNEIKVDEHSVAATASVPEAEI